MSDRQVNLTRLRERAERAIAREEAGLAREAGSPAGLELHGLVEELRVYQTELEIQNEELTLAQSQLAQSLERYRLLFDHLPLPALVVDGRGFILEVNRQASDLLNLNRTSFQQRGALFQLFDFASRGPIHFYFRGLVPAGPQILTSLVARLDEDQTLPCDLHLMPLASESPQGGQTLAVLVDRRNELALRDSERRWRELSQDYQLAKQQAESANQAKSAFLATMSHEFRTPMNIILGLTELLLSSETTPRRNNYLRKIQDVARALYGLLNDILDYSRIETGLLTIEAQPLRLYDVLDSTSQLFGHCAEEKGLDLRFEVSPEVPPLLLGDPLRLQQVLNHLVDNALKFTTAGSVRVLITRADRVLPASLREFRRQVRYGVSPACWVKLRPRMDADGDCQPGETDGRGRRCSGGSAGGGRPDPLASGRGGVTGVLRARRRATGGPGRGWRPQSGAGSASVLARAARVAV